MCKRSHATTRAMRVVLTNSYSSIDPVHRACPAIVQASPALAALTDQRF